MSHLVLPYLYSDGNLSNNLRTSSITKHSGLMEGHGPALVKGCQKSDDEHGEGHQSLQITAETGGTECPISPPEVTIMTSSHQLYKYMKQARSSRSSRATCCITLLCLVILFVLRSLERVIAEKT
jgi:hypothetical protein